MQRTGGQILIDALDANGVEVIFGVPGESYLAALDALHQPDTNLRYITARQEGGAAFMAAAYADAISQPGICFVTRGPGLSNAMIGVHTAQQASTPLIMLIGQIPSGQRDREAFQEVDYRSLLGSMVKWVAEINDPARIPEYINRAFRIATSGRPGPVALALPEDMLFAACETPNLPAAMPTPAHPMRHDLDKIGDMLATAERPLLLLGGTSWTEEGHQAAISFVENHDIPVAVGFRRQGLFPHDHPNFIGNVGFGGMPNPNDYTKSADLIIALGARLNDGTTQKFSLINAPVPQCRLVHILPGAEELGRLYQAELPILADPNLAAIGLAQLSAKRQHGKIRAMAHQDYAQSQSLPPQDGPVDMGQVMRVLNARLPRNTTMTTGAGNAADWPNIYYHYRQFRGALAPISGAMGMGVPAAIAAKFARPDAPSVYIGGDGDFLMNGQELATAVKYGIDPVFIVIDNAMYGTIRVNQERKYPGRVSGTALSEVDFATLARGYGAHAERVQKTDDFAPALERALTCGKASLIHILVGPDHLGPNLTIQKLVG